MELSSQNLNDGFPRVPLFAFLETTKNRGKKRTLVKKN